MGICGQICNDKSNKKSKTKIQNDSRKEKENNNLQTQNRAGEENQNRTKDKNENNNLSTQNRVKEKKEENENNNLSNQNRTKEEKEKNILSIQNRANEKKKINNLSKKSPEKDEIEKNPYQSQTGSAIKIEPNNLSKKENIVIQNQIELKDKNEINDIPVQNSPKNKNKDLPEQNIPKNKINKSFPQGTKYEKELNLNFKYFNIFWYNPNKSNDYNIFKKCFENVQFSEGYNLYSTINFFKKEIISEWIVITSGTHGEELILNLQNFKCIKTFFVYCKNAEFHAWAKKYDKVGYLTSDPEILCQKLIEINKNYLIPTFNYNNKENVNI